MIPKKCPFCSSYVTCLWKIDGSVVFKCPQCGAVVKFNNEHIIGHPEKAMEAWNRRGK